MISVITVNYKTADYLCIMLESLFKNNKGNFEVFVVNNDTEDNLDLLVSKYSKVKFINTEKNLGFAGACNIAIKKAKGDYVLLVNPDIVFIDDAINQIEIKMNENLSVGVGGVSLKNIDGSQQKCVWRFPTPLNQLLLLLKIHHIKKNIRPISRWRFDDFDYTKTQSVDQVMGAFFCIRRTILEEVGLLDDKYFIWYEEVDFCKRVKNAGYEIKYFSDISALHKKGSSFDRVGTLTKQNILRKSIRRYIKKHHGNIFWIMFILLDPVFFVLSFIASIVKRV